MQPGARLGPYGVTAQIGAGGMGEVYRARDPRDGRPASVSFRFRQPLEDPSLRWLYWRDRRLLEFPLPEVASSVLASGITLFPF